MMEFDCPHCRQHIEAVDEWAGLTTTCPTCSKQFEVPKPCDLNTEAKNQGIARAKPVLLDTTGRRGIEGSTSESQQPQTLTTANRLELALAIAKQVRSDIQARPALSNIQVLIADDPKLRKLTSVIEDLLGRGGDETLLQFCAFILPMAIEKQMSELST